ncbi:voltage-dependent anion-selective channel protein 1 isoform X2 [Columba livia]|uniref:voltage-dependent anion-selective channel protein 1 isoform X2 n=1 Tax=Columba livia TaxID=8932 RepID=UPI0031B9E149
MAVPPTYADLGKPARDVFNKGFGFGLVKLDLKTKSENGLEFTSSGSANSETSKVNGSLETKYKWVEYGLIFTEKWNTDNTLGTDITLEDKPARGLKLTFDSSFSPNTGKKSAKVKTGYKREHINVGCDMDFDIAGPTIHGALVVGYDGWLAGYQMNFETAKSRITQSNFAVGYKTDDFQLHTNVNDGTEFGGSIYQKVNDKLETAVNLAWTAGNSNTRFGIAAKYQIDQDASFSAKVNNSSLIGLGYTQTLKPGKYQNDFVSFAGWQECQCRCSQTWSWIGISRIRSDSTIANFKIQHSYLQNIVYLSVFYVWDASIAKYQSC